jgi:hypothetical protein
MFPMSIYLIVAASIALIAFGIGHVIPGLGVAFVAVASTLWAAYSTKRQKDSNRIR